ncbi:MAG: nuclear transport factor 2 family protein [Sphingobium sp.]
MDRTERRGALKAMLAAPLAAGLLVEPAAAKEKGAKMHGNPGDMLADLVARQQITDVLFDYARGNDRLDEALLRSCFWPDSRHQHGRFKGLSQDFIGFAVKIVGGVIMTTHAISNVAIRLKGDRAFTECYFAAHHRRLNTAKTDEEDFFVSGRYLDRFERRQGVWKIAQRRGLTDWERVEPRADVSMATAPKEHLSQRKPDDPYYTMLAEFEAGR